jgi:hypothetical protein
MTLEEFQALLSATQQRKLSGGITCNRLNISLYGTRQLTLSGDVTVTIKVIDLTTHSASKLHSLINHTQHFISSKLNGDSTPRYQVYLHNYDSKKKAFGTSRELYELHYKINYIVRLEQIKMLSQIAGNDFILAVVDNIGYTSGDSLITGGLTNDRSGPATITYNRWVGYPNVGAHEFFHTLGLDDLYNSNQKNSLMYYMGGKNTTQVSNTERALMNDYLIHEIENMYKGSYSNPGLDTRNKLQKFLNNPKYGFKFNKAKFR